MCPLHPTMGFIIRAEMKRAEKHVLELLQLVTSEGSKIELISISILQCFCLGDVSLTDLNVFTLILPASLSACHV